ncbi:uncharacterized protein LOC114945823 [Nylanderia fulva]|uniref:uncharacterized protein LOC114945823 n=1 Tax=Nylanderia fulva TaxID=613905 RepID=UPI0010FBACDC|nr:uncharacterized protein LOC114945823 [Nylanderia fulva]
MSKTFKTSKTLKMLKTSKISKILFCIQIGISTHIVYILKRLVDDISSILGMFLLNCKDSTHWLGECRFTDLVLSIKNHDGLKTQFSVKCRMCHTTGDFWSEPKDDKKLDVNNGIVSGTILTGTGHKQLEELLAAADIACMNNKKYIKHHNEMSEAFAAAAEEEMRVAGEEEKRLAIERGDVIDGIPHIPVITDGSWMKRSYRSDYGPNAERSDVEGYMYEQLKSNHYQMLKDQQSNRAVLECATRDQHEKPGVAQHTAKSSHCFKLWKSL